MRTNKTRSFGGKLSGFIDKQERAFEQKHLRAYLKGWQRFQYGRQIINGRIEPIFFSVKEVWA